MSFRKNTKSNFKTSKKDYILSIDDFCLCFIFSQVGSQKAGALGEISTNRQKNFTEVIFKVPLLKNPGHFEFFGILKFFCYKNDDVIRIS